MKRRAFTLIEVIIALAILAIAALYLLPAIYTSNTYSNVGEKDMKLSLHAQTVIENYKSFHFTGIETALALPEGIDYELKVTEEHRFIVLDLRVMDDEKEYKTKIALPKETSIYTH